MIRQKYLSLPKKLDCWKGQSKNVVLGTHVCRAHFIYVMDANIFFSSPRNLQSPFLFQNINNNNNNNVLVLLLWLLLLNIDIHYWTSTTWCFSVFFNDYVIETIRACYDQLTLLISNRLSCSSHFIYLRFYFSVFEVDKCVIFVFVELTKMFTFGVFNVKLHVVMKYWFGFTAAGS